MSLYNLRSLTEGAYMIAKFDADFNVESTYTLTASRNGHFDCDCPAGSRSVVTKPCRHRLMLPALLPAVDTDRFYDYDTKKFCEPLGDLVGEALRTDSPSEALRNEQEASERIGDDVTAKYPTEPFVEGDKGLDIHQAVETAYAVPAILAAPTIRRR